jgi:hypothetical protein
VAEAFYIDPAADPIQLVRWYLGDTATGDDGISLENPLVSDLEIEFALSQNGDDAKAAAAFCARYAAVKLLHQPQSVRLLDFSASLGTSLKELAEHYLKLAERLEREVARPNIYAGGLSVSEKFSVEQNTDRVAPFFRRGMHDYDGGY